MNTPVNHARLLLTRRLHRRPFNSLFATVNPLCRHYAQAQEATRKTVQDPTLNGYSSSKPTTREQIKPEKLHELKPAGVQGI
jgi:hypothetical protein